MAEEPAHDPETDPSVIAMDTNYDDDVLTRELERMRARLLDLSGRNPLLNYRHPRASSLRIVDEVPALVLQSMVSNGGFRFAPLDPDDIDPEDAVPDEVSVADDLVPLGVSDQLSVELGSHDDGGEGSVRDLVPLSQSARERREAAKAARARREEQIRAVAQKLGIDPSYDLPAVGDSDAEQHGDRRLQTLLAPDELEARLQKIQASAVTAVQESGANMLHLLFGFVEWSEQPNGKTRLAPLVLVPVTLARGELDRKTHTFPYVVAASGEDWSTNVSLQEKCRKDFGFVLPSVEEEENLEDYFSRVEEALTSAPAGWRVRRFLTLGLVSFGKILMWRDLDPATWPEDRPLLANPLLRAILGAEETLTESESPDVSSAETRTTEYNIDNLPAECGAVPPIVISADSSQHSVLVDVQRGDSIVVQGPPGTGKSQTITNIIAGAIAANQKVLFVAEKKAALEVVARRLADAGLGPFCLPLHSHTSNKREFLDGLGERIGIGGLGDASTEMATIEGLLTETRAELTGHAERLHAPFGRLGDTAFSILWRARRLAAELPEAAIVALRPMSIPNAAVVAPREVAKQRAALTAFAAAHTAAAADAPLGEAHPWHGVTRADLRFDDAEALRVRARDARAALTDAENVRQSLGESTGNAEWPSSPDALSPLLTRCAALVPPDPVVPGGLIEAIHLRAGAESVHAAVEAADRARRAWATLQGPWAVPGALGEATAADYAERLRQAQSRFGDGHTAGDMKLAADTLASAMEQLSATRTLTTTLASELGVEPDLPVGLALRLIDVTLAAEQLPEGSLALRSEALAAPNAPERISKLSGRAAELARTRERLDARFTPEMQPSTAELREVAGSLAEAPRFLPWAFSGAYRRAMSQYRRMSGGKKADRATRTTDVNALLRYRREYDTFVNDPALSQLLGAAADGVASPFSHVTALLNWTKTATTAFRGTGAKGRSLLEAVWNASAATWSEVSALAVSHQRARELASGLGRSLPAVSVLANGELDCWSASSFDGVREKLECWHTIAVNTCEVAQGAGIGPTESLTEIERLLDRVRHAWSADADLAKHAETFDALGLDVPPLTESDGGDVLGRIRGALTYLSQFREPGVPPATVDWLATGQQAVRIDALRNSTARLQAVLHTAAAAEATFARAGGVDLSDWYGASLEETWLNHRIDRFDRAIAAGGSLARYVTYLRECAAVAAGPIPVACELLESGAVPPEQLPDTYEYLLARTLAELVLREHPELDRFSGELHETRRAQFAALDEQFVTLTRRIVAQRACRVPHVKGVGYGAVKDLSEQSLIEHEIEKGRRHIPIREMFRRAGRAIQSLKPCIMMGPQAVAQYLPPGLFHFDLVVMDEASQMRPEDALGAIARGSQLVVVGDPKQLGPTSFFDVQANDEDEIEEAAAALAAQAAAQGAPRGASVLERSESILLAAARRYPLRMLRWHYRSRYPELIAFSNQEFYNNDLVLFPHPGVERPGDGVNFRAVENAIYTASCNLKEA